MTETGGKRSPSYPLLLLTVALGGVLAPLNSTMIAVALPEIRRDFSIGHAEIGWLVSAYLIAMAVAQPIGGRVGDQLGRARVFGAGLIAFLVLSVAAAFSPWFPVLVALRTGQALVGAAVIPNGIAMLRQSVPVSRLGQSNGFIGSALSFSAAAGPLLGAALLAVGSWRLLFLMNVPLVLLALGSLTMLRYPDALARGRFRLDWIGALTFGALLTALTLVLNSVRGGENAARLGGGMIALVLLLVAFVLRQRSSSMPIAEWRLFRSRSYAAATIYILLANLVMYTTLLSIPFFIEEVQGGGSGRSGLLLGAMSVLIAFLAPISGHISDTRGRRLPAVAGGMIMSGAVVLIFAVLSEDAAFGVLALSLSLAGLGMGLSFGAAQTAAVESAPRSLAGAAAGTNSMMRYAGSIIGVGVLGAVLTTNGDAPDVGLFRFIFAVLIGMSALATVAAFFIHRFPPEAEREAPIHTEPAPVSIESGEFAARGGGPDG